MKGNQGLRVLMFHPHVPSKEVVCFRPVCDTKNILLLIELEGRGGYPHQRAWTRAKKGKACWPSRPGWLLENWGHCAAWELGLSSSKEKRKK